MWRKGRRSLRVLIELCDGAIAVPPRGSSLFFVSSAVHGLSDGLLCEVFSSA